MSELLELQQNYVTSLQGFMETFDLARSSYARTFSEVLKDAQLQRFHRTVEDLTHFYVGYCYLKYNVEAEGPKHLFDECLKNKVATEEEVNSLSNLIELSEFFCSASSSLNEEVEEARSTFLPLAQTMLTSFAYITQALVKE